MKKWHTSLLPGFLVFLLLLSANRASGQCGLTYYAGIGVANTGTSFTTWSNYNLGQYFAMPTLNGGNYEVSTCGAAYDTQITIWDPTATSVFAYNNDNGPVCAGTSASINFTTTANGYAYIQVTQNNCVGGPPASPINLYLRQIDNIVFTSSAATMCSGETRNLSATPAPVAFAPGGYGNTGSFSGTGVSGNVFTAPVVSAPTNYTITYTFGYVSHTQVITVKPTPIGSATPTSTTLCSGSTYSIGLGSTIPGSTYAWGVVLTSGSVGATGPFNGTSPVINNTYSGNAVLSYTAVASSNGCQSPVFSSSITLNALPTVGTAASSTAVCSGGTVTLTGTGSASSYTWTNGVTNGVAFTPTSTATYTVTGTSAAGCSRTATRAITVNSLPVLSVNSGSVCAGQSFTMTPSGAVTYSYSGGSNVVSPPAGTSSYSVTGTDANGCVAASPAISSVSVQALPVIAVNSGSICAGQSFTMTPSGAATYTYSGGSNVVSPSAGTSNYSVTGTTANGCVAASPAISSVSVQALPVIAVNSGSICSGHPFTILPSGASTYTYSGGSNTVSPVLTTTYNVTGTDANGCVSSSAAISTVSVSATPTITANSGTICSGNSFTIIPGGASTYTISGGSAVVSPSSTSAYSITGTSAAGCSGANTAISMVTVNTTPTVALAPATATICSGNTVVLSPSGANTYTLQPGSVTGTSFTVNPSVGTTYTLSGTSLENCPSVSSGTAQVMVNVTPAISIAPSTATICSGNSVVLTPGGANTYTLQPGALSGTSFTLSPSSTISYTLSGTSLENCPSINTATAQVTVNATPTISIAPATATICSGNSTVLLPAGANTYTLQPGALSGTSFTLSPSSTTTYTLSGTSLQNCPSINTETAQITVNITPTVSIAPATATICSGNSTVLSPGGAHTYTLQPGTLSGTSFTLSPSSTITYTLSGTSLENCPSINTATTQVTVNITPTISIAPTTATICSGNSTVITPGGANTYTLQPGALTGTSFTLSPSSTNTYTLSGTSLQNCPSINTETAQITVNITPTVSIAPATATICSGNNTVLTPGGANTYTLQPGALSGTSFTLSPTSTTTYTLSGTSLQNCPSINTETAQITVNITPTVSIAPATATICSGNSTVLTPGGAHTYTLQPGALSGTSFTLSPSSTISYTLSGTSFENCPSINTATAQVTVNATPTISIAPATATICSGNSTVLIPGGAHTYTLQPGALSGTSFTLNPSSTISYTLSGTSLQNCPAINTETAQIIVNTTPTISIAPTTATICSGNSTVLTPGGAHTYTLQPGALSGTSFTLNPTSTISYTLNGMSLENCPAINTETAQIIVNTTPTISIAPITATICSGNSTVLTPGGANTYTLQPGALTGTSFTLSPSSTNTYTLSGTSLQNCPSVNTETAQIIVNTTPTISVSSGTICSGQSYTMVPAGAATYTFAGGSDVVSPTSTTSYTVSGSSTEGCISANTATALVTVNTTPTISLVPATVTICSGNSTVLTPGGANTYTLQPGALTGTSFTVSPSATTAYTLNGTSIESCPSVNTETALVSVNTTPTISVNSGAICIGQSFTIVPSGASTYTYSSGSPVVSPASTSAYTVTGTAANGCVSAMGAVSQVTVNSLPNIGIAPSATAICDGQGATLTASGAISYTWSTGSNAASIPVSPSANTAYTVSGSNGPGCVSSATFALTVFATPTLSIGPDVEVNFGANYQFHPSQSGAVSYSWSPATGLNDPSASDPTATAGTDITYTLTITSANGCTASDAVSITVLNELIIANYMSPNGDGANDTWKVNAPALIKDYAVEIVDQWGKTVFNKSSGYSNDWGGSEVPDGVYYYFIKDGTTVKYKGSITVTR